MRRDFKNRVSQKLKKDGYKVYSICDSICPFDLISIDSRGVVAGIRCKPHGHIYQKERDNLLRTKISIFVASEYGEHEIGMKKLDNVRKYE